MKSKNFLQRLHLKTKRNYLERMNDNKVFCMKIAKKYEKDYWDGKRKFGYGGYKYIAGRWTEVAKKIIKNYKLKPGSKILDIGCGKGYLLYELTRVIPNLRIVGLDVSRYAVKNSKPEIKKFLKVFDIKNKIPFKKRYFDLVLCLGTLHNLDLYELNKSIKEINRVGKKKYLMVESFRNDQELFNLQCWALTCKTFLSPSDWKWFLKSLGYNGDIEFIYFS